MLELLPDVQIFHNAVRYALNYDEFYKTNQTQVARDFLRQAHERAQLLREGNASWGTATGLIVRGYVSKIDGSVQPYGLVVPPTYQAGSGRAHRLDLGFTGGETLTELDFINAVKNCSANSRRPTFVLHPTGVTAPGTSSPAKLMCSKCWTARGSIIRLMTIASVVRLAGRRGVWAPAVHYAGLWAAAPGAAFPRHRISKVFQKETQRQPGMSKTLALALPPITP
jgi:hypothetical protein